MDHGLNNYMHNIQPGCTVVHTVPTNMGPKYKLRHETLGMEHKTKDINS